MTEDDALRKLAEIPRRGKGRHPDEPLDRADAHDTADIVLIEFLEAQGFHRLVAAYETMRRWFWYS